MMAVGFVETSRGYWGLESYVLLFSLFICCSYKCSNKQVWTSFLRRGPVDLHQPHLEIQDSLWLRVD